MNQLIMHAHTSGVIVGWQGAFRDERDDGGELAWPDPPDMKIRNPGIAVLDRLPDFFFKTGIGGGVDEHGRTVAQQAP